MPTLHLMVGLPCAGKTTRAQALEAELGALRLTPDDWHRALFGQDATHPEHDERHARIEALQLRIAQRALSLGLDVILDFGFWAREERDAVRRHAAKLGAATVTHFLDEPVAVLRRRLEQRNAGTADAATHIPLAMFDAWVPHFERPDADEIA